jgi:hypothetical protein
MGLVPVNPLPVTSVVGHGPDTDGEFVVTRLARNDERNPGDHRGTQLQINRRPSDSDTDHRADGHRGKQDKTSDGRRLNDLRGNGQS